MENETLNHTGWISRCIDPKFDVYFGIQMFFLVATAIWSVVANSSMFYVLHYSTTLQSTVKLFLQNMTIGFLSQALSCVCQFVYTILVFVIGYQQLFRTPALCVLLQTPGTVGLSCVIFSFLFISIEHLIYLLKGSTLLQKKENEKVKLWVKVVVILTWITGIPNLILPVIQSRNRRVCYCALSYVTRDVDLFVIAAIYIFAQVVSVVLYPTVCYLTRKEIGKFDLNSDTHSLDQRSRAWGNVRTTLMLLPSTVLQGVLFLLGLILQVVTQDLVFNTDLSTGLDIRLSLLWIQMFVLFWAVHPVLCLRRHHSLANTAIEKRSMLSLFVRSAKVDVVGETANFCLNPDAHMNNLSTFWEVARAKQLHQKP